MMIIVPLIIASLSTSIAGTKEGENKRLIIYTFLLIILFASFCSSFGAIMVSVMKPGVRPTADIERDRDDSQGSVGFDVKQMIASQDESIYDVFMNLIPDNIIAATFTTHYTALVAIDKHNLTLGYKKQAERAFKPNLLGLCVFSLILGFAVLNLGPKADTIKCILVETNAVAMKILTALIRIMPIGMFCWMTVQAIKMKAPGKMLGQLAWFYGTVFLTYGCIWFIFYPTIYFILTRKNCFKMYFNIIPAMIVALGSSSREGLRTATNITGDSVIAHIVQKLIKMDNSVEKNSSNNREMEQMSIF
ncbi:unnamed protein product [Oppiella nova]|uniref:Amino acid transporter n=1 Tax=Oppiella nova TaxID=334625 RepID=A0A7R9M4B9_9ACAR|nr:unnamed protein product [Oppiella nova]CAG2170541.1 unnamed protein product [Oppiella nova]